MKLLKFFLLCILVTSLAACENMSSDTETDDTTKTTTTTDDTSTNPSTTAPKDEPTNTATTPPDEPSGTSTSNTSYMTADENRMVDEINLIRTNPPAYVKYVNEYIAQM